MSVFNVPAPPKCENCDRVGTAENPVLYRFDAEEVNLCQKCCDALRADTQVQDALNRLAVPKLTSGGDVAP